MDPESRISRKHFCIIADIEDHPLRKAINERRVLPWRGRETLIVLDAVAYLAARSYAEYFGVWTKVMPFVRGISWACHDAADSPDGHVVLCPTDDGAYLAAGASSFDAALRIVREGAEAEGETILATFATPIGPHVAGIREVAAAHDIPLPEKFATGTRPAWAKGRHIPLQAGAALHLH